MRETGRSLDVAISGDGFFKVRRGNETLYTRNGNFFTDENGYFELPIKTDVVTLGKLSTFVMAQEIYVHFQGEKLPVWAKSKRKKGLYGELDGVPQDLKCDLADGLVRLEVGEGMLLTSCKWDLIKEL